MYRVLIADDEPIECQGLEMMMKNYFEDVEILPSVYNGVDLIKSVTENKPDIAIVDINMPGLNGLEALEILKLKSLSVKMIINTAYSDFTLIQKAIVLGACDYILKPTDQEKFCQTIKRVCQMIDQEKEADQKTRVSTEMIDQMKEIIEEEMMSSIILGTPNEKSFLLYLKNEKMVYRGSVFVTAVTTEKRDHIRLEKIEQIIRTQLKKFCRFQIRRHQNVLYLHLIAGNQITEENYREWMENLLQVLNKKIFEQEETQMRFGVSGWKYEFEKLGEALRESRIAAAQSAKHVIFYEKENIISRQVIFQEEFVEEIVSKLLDNEIGEINEQLKKKLEQILKGNWGRESIQMEIISFLMDVYKKLHDKNELDMFCQFSYQDMLRKMQECRNEEEMMTQAVQIIQQFQRKIKKENKHTSYEEKAILYMEQNYMNDISLDEVAEHAGISSFYLSRLLKQKNNSTFVEMLTDIRIREAILMLRQKDVRIKDIGERVGYLNPTYFYKVFKKNTGMTVGEMKEYFDTL